MAGEQKDVQGAFCPIVHKKCNRSCMWLVDGRCAVAVLAEQARRQGDELYAMVEVIGGAASAPDEGAREA